MYIISVWHPELYSRTKTKHLYYIVTANNQVNTAFIIQNHNNLGKQEGYSSQAVESKCTTNCYSVSRFQVGTVEEQLSHGCSLSCVYTNYIVLIN